MHLAAVSLPTELIWPQARITTFQGNEICRVDVARHTERYGRRRARKTASFSLDSTTPPGQSRTMKLMITLPPTGGSKLVVVNMSATGWKRVRPCSSRRRTTRWPVVDWPAPEHRAKPDATTTDTRSAQRRAAIAKEITRKSAREIVIGWATGDSDGSPVALAFASASLKRRDTAPGTPGRWHSLAASQP